MNTIVLNASLFCMDNLMPILVGLLGAAALGWLLKHFLGGGGSSSSSNNEWEAKYQTAQADLNKQKELYAQLQNKKSKASTAAAPMAVAAATGISANEAEQLNNKVKNLKAELKTVTDAKIQIEGDLNAANARAREANTLNSEVETLKTRIEGLNRALDASKIEADKYKSEFETANSERSRLSANLQSSDTGAMQKRITKLEDDLNNSRITVATLTSELGALKNKPKTVADVMESAVPKADTSAPELRKQLASAETALSKANADKERMEKEVEMKQLAINAAVNEANTKNNAELLEMRDKLKYFEAKISRLEDENTKLALNSGTVVRSAIDNPTFIKPETKAEAPKAAEVKVEAPKVEEAPKAEAPKVEEAKVEAPQENVAPTAAANNDDLTVVEGIGPKIATILNSNGINSFAQLADTTPDAIKGMLQAEGGITKNAEPGTWPEQAALLRDGKMDEFKALTDELVAGVRVEGDGPAKSEDLTVVEGIGPKIADILNNNSIYNYTQLADATPEAIKGMLQAEGGITKNADPGTWPEQAALLRDGKMDEFKALTDELVAGVRIDEEAEAAAQQAEAAAATARAEAAKANPDDLKVLEGVGPVLEGILNNGGVYTYAQLADMSSDEVKAILEAAGDIVHDPASWPEQATLLRDGKMDEFKALCDELKGGRRV
jgi:predicted flap endonuclease-1-like 5' DNA nuclease